MSAAQLQAAVGQRYHVGFGDGTHFYGYVLVADTAQSGGWHEKTDIAAKDAQIQYASPNIIDRDFVFWPRVTQGDWSGGSNQITFISPTQYWDSDLDTRVPGYLRLRPQWARVSKAGLASVATSQVVAWNGDFWFTFGEANGNIYSANGGTTTSPVAAVIRSIMSDGTYLYAGTNAQLYRTNNGTVWTAVTSAVNGAPSLWWVVVEGTNGYFAYYWVPGTTSLYKIDLTQGFPIGAATQPQVPTGSAPINVIDVCAYQSSIAVLTNDINASGSDIWYFDGANFTRIIRIEGFLGVGICNSLGSLYVGAQASGKTTSPKLFQIVSGSYNEVVIPGLPFPTANQSCLPPTTGGRYVYWPLLSPSVNGISTAPGVILQFDTLTAATSKLPDLDATDFHDTYVNDLRTVALLGENVACCFGNNLTGILQYQLSSFGTIKYELSGKMVTSRIDFQTPGVEKRFRRLEAQHAPLPTNCSVKIDAFIDKDPAAYTAALIPDATITNTVAATVSTELFLNNLIGHTVYFVLTLATSDGLNTPSINYYFVEATTPWSWELLLNCTELVTLLSGDLDAQGIKGKDRAYFFRNAWESPAKLTMYHRNGNAYTVAIESLDFWNPSPHVAQEQQVRDEGYFVKVILRQTL